MYLKNRISDIFLIFSVLVCILFGSQPLLSQTVTDGTVTFGGMGIESEVESDVCYIGNREIRPDLRIAAEEWQKIIPKDDGKNEIIMGVKPPESEVYTYTVKARGQGRIDLTLNDCAISYDVGEFRQINVAPTSLTVKRKFILHDREKCTVIRSYQSGYVADYYDTCIPIANEGFKSEVVKGEEPLSATASVTPWEIDVVYGTETQVSNSLGFSAGWPPSVTANAGWGETNTQKWGWKLRETNNKTLTVDPPFSGTFEVRLNDTDISESKDPIPVTGCVTCPNCDGSVNTVDDHVKKVMDFATQQLVPATCPVEAVTEPPGTEIVPGCGKKVYECTPQEASLQAAWHQIRTCKNKLTSSLLRKSTCDAKFRHCINTECLFRRNRNRGHSDGSVSQAPAGVTNAYAESHLIDPTPEPEPTPAPSETIDNTPDCSSCTDGCSTCQQTTTPAVSQTPGLRPVNGSTYYANGGDIYNMELTTSEAYTFVYWYIKPPGDTTAYGNDIEIDNGDGSTTTASLSYTLPSDNGGNYRITAYIYYSDRIAEETYDVYVY